MAKKHDNQRGGAVKGAAPSPPPQEVRTIKVVRPNHLAFGGPTEAEIPENVFPSWERNGWTKREE